MCSPWGCQQATAARASLVVQEWLAVPLALAGVVAVAEEGGVVQERPSKLEK